MARDPSSDVGMKRDQHGRLIYEPDGAVLADFVLDNSEVAIIQGPMGSGKSKAANIRIYRHAREQRLSRLSGRRHSRWAVVRNTYPDLEGTTIRTWLDTFPEHVYGKMKWSKPFYHRIEIDDVILEADFLALDKEEDVRKLRSAEYTGFYINEGQYIPKVLFDEMHSRAGRFPAVKDGGTEWCGVIMDMNAPEDEANWVAIMTGQVPFPEHWTQQERALAKWPAEWKFFMQPPGLLEDIGPDGLVRGYKPNPKAENTRWLAKVGGKPFYMSKISGKSKAWIDSRIMNRVTIYADGDPVWPQFRLETHVMREMPEPVEGSPVFVGLDFGRSPAAVFFQKINHRVVVLYELQAFDCGARRFIADHFAPEVERRFGDRFELELWGDPKGRDRTQADDVTAFDMFEAKGFRVRPAPVKGNNIETRIEVVENLLLDMRDGIPCFMLSPACRRLKAAMAGKYFLEKSNDASKRLPCKDDYSHLPDALGYGLLGAGEGARMVGRSSGRARAPARLAKPRSLRKVQPWAR
ncbi:hypothetical protein [Blastochloris tepida]|uniref:Terminase large subunit n=1 Tax=Blastochloris tepida TaxID=2233851 RepID=A0A348FZB5_9HYPH|nr:hypothetical protein [Blastochloris tepida]BBF92648.1 hypothetical protein BLTE_13330 [Blastochloris tepida]